MGWEPLTPSTGSEGGIVLADETYLDASRITLERDTSTNVPAAITCGIYGWMVHTRFFPNVADARRAYEDMKVDLAAIVDRIPLETDSDCDARMPGITEAIRAFVKKHP